MLQQVIWNLIHPIEQPSCLRGLYFDEEKWVPVWNLSQNYEALAHYHYHKLVLHYLFGEHQEAEQHGESLKQWGQGLVGSACYPLWKFYESLNYLRLFEMTREDRSYLVRVEKNLQELQLWAKRAPMNHQHRLLLIEAEWLRIKGELWSAHRKYEEAGLLAKKNGYLQEEGLIYECAGQAFHQSKQKKQGCFYLEEADCCYRSWQALAKVRQLGEVYSFLKRQGKEMKKQPLLSNKLLVNRLGMIRVLRAIKMFSRELSLDKLLKLLLTLTVEHTKAQRGFILLEQEKQWSIEASWETGQMLPTLSPFIALDSSEISACLPAAVIHYVIRTHRLVVESNPAQTFHFIRDIYIQEKLPKSILCLPLIHHKRLAGVLYLENNEKDDHFTLERIQFLKHLSVQMAISINNTRQIRELEGRNLKTGQQLMEVRQETERLCQLIKEAGC